MSEEVWRDVGENPMYEVSNLGRARSKDRIVRTARSASCMRVKRGVVLRACPNSSGYRTVLLYAAGKPKNRSVHRLVLTAFKGEPPEGAVCNHIDGDKTNNRVENLEWSTPKLNTVHAYANGLIDHCRGDDVGTSKLTTDDVREIRRLSSLGKTQTEIAKSFRICRANVSMIVSRHRWKHVE
jgi:hypothetical protein